MSTNNQVVLIGYVGNEVRDTLRYVEGSAVVELRLAVPRPGNARDGEQITDWVGCQFWDRQAEVLAQYAAKGMLLSVMGSLRIDSWENDGQRRQKVYVRATQFEFLGRRKGDTLPEFIQEALA